MPLRKPGTEGDKSYDIIDDEEPPPDTKSTATSNRGRDNKHDYNNRDKNVSLRTMVITTVVLSIVTVAIIGTIIYLLCQKKTKRKKFLIDSRRNVLTFRNPNYSAATGTELQTTTTNQQQEDKKSFIWKRLRYDKSQVKAYNLKSFKF